MSRSPRSGFSGTGARARACILQVQMVSKRLLPRRETTKLDGEKTMLVMCCEWVAVNPQPPLGRIDELTLKEGSGAMAPSCLAPGNPKRIQPRRGL